MTEGEFITQALAAGWDESIVESFVESVRYQKGTFELAHHAVLALRTGRGARQCQYRGETVSEIFRARVALEGIPEYIPPAEYGDGTP
jgi:hypothetical protein